LLIALLPVRFDFAEELAAREPDGITASQILPAPDRCIDVKRIEFNPATDTARSLGGEQGRAAA